MISLPYRHGFTLIELLIVVSIISILAVIALPNFLEAQTRSKIARVKADQRTMATALETYAVDNNSYPPVPMLLPPRFRLFRPLTSPVSYMSDIPTDPFKSVDANGHGRFRMGMYMYGGTPIDKPSRWALGSDGPDRRPDCDPLMFYPGYTPELFDGTLEGFDFTLYDASNGTISKGDILRASDYIPVN